MDNLGLTPSERELRKLARDLKRDEDERRRIFQEEMRRFQTQRQEYVRQVAQTRETLSIRNLILHNREVMNMKQKKI